MAVLLLHVTAYVGQCVGMGMVLQMAVQLFADAADVLQPLVEADLVLGFLRHGHDDPADGPRRHDAAHGHHLAVASAQDVVYHGAQRGARHTRRAVGQTDDDFAAVIFVHGVQDASRHVGAHAVEYCHRHVGGCGYHLRVLQQATAHFHASLGSSFGRVGGGLAFVRHEEAHEAVGDKGVTDEDGQLCQHVDIGFLAVGDEALAVVGAAVVLEGCVAQGKLLGSATRG